MKIVPADPMLLSQWAELRLALWPWDTASEHAEEAARLYLSGNPDAMAMLAVNAAGDVAGFAEAMLRRDYVEGCDSSPVLFLEGIYVRPDARNSGVATALVDAVGKWGRAKGCTEFASNALIDNDASHAFHRAIGFEETERVVYFRKSL